MGVEAKFAKTEDSFFRIRSPIAQLWGKKAGKNGPVSRKLQPTFPKSDRLLGYRDEWRLADYSPSDIVQFLLESTKPN